MLKGLSHLRASVIALTVVSLVFGVNAMAAEKSKRVTDFKPLPKELKKVWLDDTTANFNRHPDTFSWISDVEHVCWAKSGKVYLADAKVPYYLCGAVVPGQSYFELFPYHYYDQKEVDELGGEINYKLIVKNINATDVVLEIEGQGTTTDWDHYKTWEGAYRGDGKRIITIKPGQTITLWEEKKLKGDLPWSGIFFGKANGDLWVCDYAYLGDNDPGVENAKPVPDLSQPPVNWPSYTRGVANWNGADIELFPASRTVSGRIDVANVKEGIYGFAIADSPGGPQNNPSEYEVIEGSFASDELVVLDPVSQKSHRFFGGNYTIMYDIKLPLANTSDKPIKASFMVCSNDKFNVDTIVGLWMNEKMKWARVPMIGKNMHWKVVSVELKPGEIKDFDFTLIPLGSRWGGMVCSFVVEK